MSSQSKDGPGTSVVSSYTFIHTHKEKKKEKTMVYSIKIFNVMNYGRDG